MNVSCGMLSMILCNGLAKNALTRKMKVAFQPVHYGQLSRNVQLLGYGLLAKEVVRKLGPSPPREDKYTCA